MFRMFMVYLCRLDGTCLLAKCVMASAAGAGREIAMRSQTSGKTCQFCSINSCQRGANCSFLGNELTSPTSYMLIYKYKNHVFPARQMPNSYNTYIVEFIIVNVMRRTS